MTGWNVIKHHKQDKIQTLLFKDPTNINDRVPNINAKYNYYQYKINISIEI